MFWTIDCLMNFRKYCSITLLSKIFAGRKFRGFAIFCQIAKFNSREYQYFFANHEISFREFLKVFGLPRNSNFENPKILINGIPIKYDNSLMKVKKSSKSRLKSKPIHAKWLVDF